MKKITIYEHENGTQKYHFWAAKISRKRQISERETKVVLFFNFWFDNYDLHLVPPTNL